MNARPIWNADLSTPKKSGPALSSSVVIFGEIVAASIWDEILKASPDKRYELLDQIVFLEDGIWGEGARALQREI
jgi:hypothetical protein